MRSANNKQNKNYAIIGILVCVTGLMVFAAGCGENNKPTTLNQISKPAAIWNAPNDSTIPAGKQGEMIRYGRELLAHTANYFGPKGSIAPISNGMNCQNCHSDGGTKLFANNYASVAATYPKFNPRAGQIASLSKRITECFERSLNGKAPDTTKKEVKAIIAYIEWLGQGVKKNSVIYGNAVEKLTFMDKAADPKQGKIIFMQKCQSCHGKNGEGILAVNKIAYTYPPLWGKHSYNDGAGMYRITKLAGFIKNNMPFGATYKSPLLTNEEAWNLAAFINSQPRPHRDPLKDWPKLNQKPIDIPYGPYADTFSEQQHKYGPFKPIIAMQKAIEKTNSINKP